ncbi:MAG: hypothetical protein AAF399_26860 [Bacteroidota bacterium]
MKRFFITRIAHSLLGMLGAMLCWLPCYGQGTQAVQGGGARAAGLAYAHTAVEGDAWSGVYNPASLPGGEGLQVGLYLEQRFLLSELSLGQAVASFPVFEDQAIGVEVASFGFSEYRENFAGLSYGITFLDKISVGAKLAYTTVQIPTYGSTGALMVQIGSRVQLNPELSLGVSAFNVARARWEVQGREENLPTSISAGLAYQPSQKVLLVADVHKTELLPISFRGGIEYHLHRLLCLRVGVITEPLGFHGGLGLKLQQWTLDLAASYTDLGGYSPHLSLTYRMGQ